MSNWGANDMIGNLWEYVGDWVPVTETCDHWPAGYGSDMTCLGYTGSATASFPGALIRGGGFTVSLGSDSGPFALSGNVQPTNASNNTGFRGAR